MKNFKPHIPKNSTRFVLVFLLGLFLLLFSGTLKAQVTVLSQDFESGVMPPAGWVDLQGGSGNLWVTNTTGPAHGGSYAAEYDYNLSNAANTWLISPGVSLIAGNTYTITYWEQTGNGFNEQLKVTVGTAQTIVGQTTTLQDLGSHTTSQVYIQRTTTYTPVTGGTYYFGWNCYSVKNKFFEEVDDILITYCPIPTITTQPTSQNQCAGQSVDFSIVASNPLPLTYQWKYNGNPVANGTPANAVYTNPATATMTVSGAIAAGTYTPYTCVVTNVCGSVTSSSVSLIVSASAAPATPPNPTSGALACNSVTLTATGSPPVNETWYWQGTSCGLNTGMGSAPATYTATTSQTYNIRSENTVTGCWSSSCGSINALVLDAPVIVTNPVSTSIGCNGTPVTFYIETTGAGLTYQWQENGVNISDVGIYSGCTTQTLTLSDPTGKNGKTYQCVVTGTCGTATSAAATLSVLATGLSGIKTVGTAGNYTTLKLAFDAINANGLTGNLELQIISNITDNTEAILNQWNNCGNTGYTVKIYPHGGSWTLAGSKTTSLITLNGADNVTIDGEIDQAGATKNLIISNTDLTFVGSTIKFIGDACNNTIKYCTIKGVENTYTTGEIFFSTATTTGNNNNTIDNCDIMDGATTPANGIYALGTAGKENNNNTISNCNIYNQFKGSGGYASGIDVEAGNTKWTISGNSFYQTASRTDCSFWLLDINCSGGSEFIIDGNYIGGTAPNCGGSALTSTASAYVLTLYAINLNVSTSGISIIRNNILKNINFTTFPASTGTYSFICIGASGRTDVTGNTIGDAATGSILFTYNANSTYSGGMCGIYKDGDGNVLNNNIGSITINGTIAKQCLFNCIQSTGTLINDVLISGNTIGNSSTANSIQTAAGATPAVTISGIYFGTAGSFKTTVSNNIVANITMGCTATMPFFLGITNQATAGTQIIVGNTVSNISTVCKNVTLADMPSMLGIINNNATTDGLIISNNIIHSLSSTGAAGVYTYGIKCYNASGTNIISSNFIHSIKTSNATAVIKGITTNSGNATITNNMIRLGIDKDGNSISTGYIYGMEKASASTINTYFNSVYVGGTSTDAINSVAFYRSNNAASENVLNNIFYNARTGGTGKHFAIVTNVVTGLTSNYNDLFTSVGGANLGSYDNMTTARNYTAWQNLVRDLNSINSDPSFVTPTGTATTVNLHINSGSPPIGVGWFGTGVLVDYDNQQRKTGVSPAGPCMGADENDVPPLAMNAYGIYMPATQPTGTIADCEIYATGGTPGGIGNSVVNPTTINYANVGISGYQIITDQNIQCTNTNTSFTTTDGTPDWLLGNGSNPSSGSTTPIVTQYSSLGRKDIIESVKVFKDFVNMTMPVPSPGSILGAPSGAGCPTTYSYTSSVAGSAGFTYLWTATVPGGCSVTIVSPTASTTDVTFVNLTGVNQVFVLTLQITTECCGPLTIVKRYITIYPSPNAPAVTGSPFTLCTGGSQSFSVNGPNPAYSYEWYSASTGCCLLGSGTTYTVNPVLSGATSYWIQATNSYGCASPRTSVAVNGNNTTAPAVPDNSTCGAGDVTLAISLPGAGYTYNWYSGSCGGTLLQSSTSTSFTTNIVATTTFYVSAIPPGCGASTCTAVTATYNIPPNPVIWAGGTGGLNNWFIPANWGGCLPTCGSNVRIPSGTPSSPDIGFNATGAAACQDMDLQSGAILSFSDTKAELDICGNFINNGTFTAIAGSTVMFVGSFAQTISGASVTTFSNLNINNTSATGVTLAQNTNVSGSLILTDGQLILNSKILTIQNSSPTAISGGSSASYIVSETNVANNTSILKWNIGTDITAHVFPFGTVGGYYIPVTFTGSGTGPGNISISTRPTLANDNLLYPAISNVAAVTSMTGIGTAITTAIDRFWDITSSLNSFPGTTVIPSVTLTLTYLGTENTTSVPTDILGFQHWTGVSWNDGKGGAYTTVTSTGTNGFAPSSPGPHSVTAGGLTQFSPYVIVRVSSPLPIELISFNVKCDVNKIIATWQTASETNNAYFNLEESFDGENFSIITQVPSHGNSNVTQSYSATDYTPFNGTNYYRLKQTDLDGQYTYSDIVSLNCSSVNYNEDILPVSPSNGSLDALLKGIPGNKYQIKLTNILGQVIINKEITLSGEQQKITVYNTYLAKGVYYLFMQTENKNISKPVIIN